MRNLPFWAPKKDTFVWYFVFIGLFCLSLDFWNWWSSTPLFFGLPLWMWFLMFLTLALSGIFYLFTTVFWKEDE